MSERKIDVDLTKNTEVTADKAVKADLKKVDLETAKVDVDAEEKLRQETEPTEEEKSQFRARAAQVLDRSLTIDRLSVPLPKHLESRWEANDPFSIASAELRGYVIDTEYATKTGLTDVADGKARIADVVHMYRPKWMGEEEKKVKAHMYHENHIKDRRKQKEERDFLANNELPVALNDSKYTEVTGTDIQEALKAT